MALLFKKQRQVYQQLKKCNKNTLCCGRGTGKSYLVVARLILECMSRPKSKVVYVTKTKTMAMQIIWTVVLEFLEKLNIDAEKKYAEKRFVFPNGSQIMLAGADDNKRIDDLRGQTFHFACVDECGQLNDLILHKLITQVIEPRLYGDLLLTGTPGILPRGYYYDSCHDETGVYNQHGWSIADNPFLPEDYLELRKVENGWSDRSPILRREYLGEWVMPSDDELVFSMIPEKNLIQEMPEYWHPTSPYWTKILAIDYGFGDATAISLIAYPNKFAPNLEDHNMYVVASDKWAGKTPSEIAIKTIDWIDKYKPTRVVGDVGGVGVGYKAEAEAMFREMRLRHSLTIHLVQKKDKQKSIEFMNDDFSHGRLKILEPLNKLLIEELLTIQWQADRRDVLKSCEDDIADATRYAHRECRSTGFNPVLTPDEQMLSDQIESKKLKPEDAASMYNRRLKSMQQRRQGGRRWKRSQLARFMKQ